MKSNNGTFIAPKIKSFYQKKSKSMHISKSAILAIFQTGPEWLCTVSAALKNPSQDFKILFASSADESIGIQEGKIREAPFFKGSIG